jgi:microsomal prostaglandin-E synthase 2
MLRLPRAHTSRLLRSSRLVVVPFAAGAATSAICAPRADAARFSTLSTSTPPPSSPVPHTLPGGALSVVIYAYETCPFCNKVRAYLDAVKVPYVVVEVEPLLKGELAWWPSYKKVPLAVVNGVVVTDSARIIDAVENLLRETTVSSPRSRTNQQLPLLPLTALSPAAGGIGESQRRQWVDDVLVKLLTVNIYRTPSEALGTFDYLTQRNFSAWSAFAAKYIGAAAMYGVARSRLTALKLPPGVDERAALATALTGFINDMNGAPFAGGSKPDISDVSAFGVLRAIKGLPTHTDALTMSSAGPWYERMVGAVGPSAMAHRVFEAPGEK